MVIIQEQANNPEINAAIKPALIIPICELSKLIFPSSISLATFPKIKGTTIKKEKRAALVLSTPNKTEVDIVAPEREIPGSIAIACEIPITKAFVKDTLWFVFLALSAKNNKPAVINNMKQTSKI